MARAKRHYIPDQVWHITQRCHKRDFLLKFKQDRHQWIKWLFEAKRRFGLVVLNYTVTCNHIHLLVKDDSHINIIPQSIGLIAGRTAQAYNRRKHRQGAFWQDRYHATAIQTGKHLLRCLVYIDLNMVRAGVVNHPSNWLHCGYNEIQKPRRKNVIIAYERLRQLAGFDDYGSFTLAHYQWVQDALGNKKLHREKQWTKSVAVGSHQFALRIKSAMGVKAKGRSIHGENGRYELRETMKGYNAIFSPENCDIGPKSIR